MTYELETSSQLYKNQQYLAHKLKGETEEEDRYFFGARIPSFGTIDFGSMAAGSTKNYTPADYGVKSDMMLCSIFAFTTAATSDEVTFKLFWQGQEFLEQKISSSDIPYQFPDGAIINPNVTIQVKPKYHTTQLLITWKPVHLLHYHRV